MATFGFNNRTMAPLAQPSTIMVEVPARPGRRSKPGTKPPRGSSNRRTAIVMMSTDDFHDYLKTLSTTKSEKLSLLNDKLQLRKISPKQLVPEAYDALEHYLMTAIREFDSVDVVPITGKTAGEDDEDGNSTANSKQLTTDERRWVLGLAKAHAFELVGYLRQYIMQAKDLPDIKACFYDDVMLCRDTHLLQHALNQIMSETCVHGVLLSSPFKHGARTFEPRDYDKTLSGGIITYNDVSQLMATFPVATSGMPVYFCLSGVSLEQGACSMQRARAFAETTIKFFSERIADFPLDDADDVQAFASSDLYRALFSGAAGESRTAQPTALPDVWKTHLTSCIQSIMMRPHASVVATFSHESTPDLPAICARKYVGISTMMSKAVYNDGDIGKIVHDKRAERRRELPRPFVIRCI